MTPDVSTPCSTACAQPAGAADRVDRAHVVAVPAFDRLAGVEVHAERRAEQRLLDVVDGQRVARRAGRRRSRRESSSWKCGDPPVCTTTGPATTAMRPPAALTSRIIAAMRATPTSTRRSDEISFVMNAKPWRSRSWNSGITRTPADAADDRDRRSRTSRSLRQTRALPSMTMTASIRCCSTSIQWPPMPHQRPVVRRRIEVVRHAAVAVGRLAAARPAGRPAGSRARRAPRAPARGPARSAPRSASRSNDGSSLLRPMSNLQHVERRVALDDGVEDDVQDLRVDQVAFGLDDLAESTQALPVMVTLSEDRQRQRRLRRGSRSARRRPARGRAPTRSTPRASSRTAGDPSGTSAAAARPRC